MNQSPENPERLTAAVSADSLWRYDQDTMEKYAALLLWALNEARKEPLKKSDLVLVQYDLEALPLAEEVVAALHVAGQVPVPRMEPTVRMQREHLLQANRKRLLMEIPGERELYASLAGSIRILAPQAYDAFDDIDPELCNIAQRGSKSLQDVLFRREQSGGFGWTVALYPSKGGARAAGMSLKEYARRIEVGCLLNTGTPLSTWKLLRRKMDDVTDALNAMPITSLRVQSENSDLLVRLGQRRVWKGFTGRNIPSFEVFTCPDWRGVEGTFYANAPTFSYGTRIEGLRLTFRYGEAVEATAADGASMAVEKLRIDPGANKVGEFALVDKRFSPIDQFMGSPLFDENLGGEHGSFHIAMGQADAAAYSGQHPLSNAVAAELGFNNSALHWDLVSNEPREVYAVLEGGGRELIYENGQFVF